MSHDFHLENGELIFHNVPEVVGMRATDKAGFLLLLQIIH